MVLIQNHNEERREHFRINDSLFIQYKVIDQETAEQLGQQLINIEHGETNQHQVQLLSLQTAFTLVTDQINHYDREVARALRLLNEKINLIERSINKPDPTQIPSQKRDVNLSGGGLGLLTEQQLQTKSAVSVQIELRSSGVTIQAVASTIFCTKVQPENNETPYYLRLAFTKMNEQDRDLLIKHILFRQAEELRANNDLNRA